MGNIASFPNPERHQHGTRARYVGAKCRCRACKDANVAYYHQRKKKIREAAEELEAGPPAEPVPRRWTPRGSTDARVRVFKNGCPGLPDIGSCPWESYIRVDSAGGVCSRCRANLVNDPVVPAGPVRAHLRRLSKKNVGYRTVADAARVAASVLADVIRGKRKNMRQKSVERVLAVTEDARADSSLVPADRARKQLAALLEAGWTKRAIAEAMGSEAQVPALQVGKGTDLITARNELAIARLFRSGGPPPPRNLGGWRARADSWAAPDAHGLQQHRACKGRGCPACGGDGWRRCSTDAPRKVTAGGK